MRLQNPAKCLALAACCLSMLAAGMAAMIGTPGIAEAATPAAPVAPQSEIVRKLIALSDAWDRAIVSKDAQAVQDNMAMDFTQIDKNGSVIPRGQFIREILDPTLTIDPYRVEEFSVRVYGDTALLTGKVRMTGTSGEKAFASHFRYIDVYVKRNGKWQVVSVQASPIPK
ncbi:MAG: nuclear transport factor 2 family protein [Pseudomonadota bacterium]